MTKSMRTRAGDLENRQGLIQTTLWDHIIRGKPPRGVVRAQALRALAPGRVVYAMELTNGVIKIGCTRNLDRRRKEVGRGAEILGFIPGDFDDEKAIHAELKPHRAHGHEYYQRTPEVLAVVNAMRDAYNLPHLTV